jgi:DNA-binding PadR family transcriptional regulator
MPPAEPTTLGYAILGLLHSGERSGYALMKVFRDTALGRFSASPGAIYPALKSLEKADWIAARETGGGEIKRRNVFRPTRKGRTRFRRWLEVPGSEEDVSKRMEIVMLRFSLMEGVSDQASCLAFLADTRDQLEVHRANLRAQRKTLDGTLSLHGRLALDAGIEVYGAWLRWSKVALEKLESAG